MPAEPMTDACPFCRLAVHPDAARCPHCTGWIDRPRLRGAAAALSAIGQLWIVVSVLAAIGLAWSGLTAARGGASDLALAAAVLGQGLLVGTAAVVLANRDTD